MGFLDFFKSKQPKADAVRAQAVGDARAFTGLDDPNLLEFIRAGVSGAGATAFLRNMAALRCATLISNSIGMLPLNLHKNKKQAKDHPVYKLLKWKPNGWMTPIEFKSFLQLQTLLHGNGYARVLYSRGKPSSLIPLASTNVTPKLRDDWQMEYEYSNDKGGLVIIPAHEMFHLRDISVDGVKGVSRTKLAQGAVELAQLAEEAAKRIFTTGVMAGGALEAPGPLSDEAFKRLKESMDNYSGVEGINAWMILEEGLKANKFANTAADAQQIENRNHQIEEVARLFGVPRPLLMMDDTSWGSGIEQLAIFFVQYTLAPWFVAWEQALTRVLLSENEYETYQFKFNERALLRGTLKDQSDYFAKALGAGGHKPWMTQNEVRDYAEMNEVPDPSANELRNPMTEKSTANEPTNIA